MFGRALALGAIALVASLSTARGAGWSGYYIGLQAGYGEGDTSSTRTITNNTYFAPSSITALESASNIELQESTFAGGATFGVNWEITNFIIGVEFDGSGFGNDTSESATVVYPCCGPSTFTTSSSLEQTWFGTARARIGLSSAWALVYGTGGLAVSDTKLTQTFSDTSFPIALQTITNSDILTGWTVGGGVELSIESGASIKFEYLYLDLGDIDAVGPIATGTTTSSGRAEVTDQIVRAGINFQLN